MTGGSRTNKLRQNARRAHLANGDRAPRRANQPAPPRRLLTWICRRWPAFVLGPDLNRSESAVKLGRPGPSLPAVRGCEARLSQRGWVEPAHGQHGDIVGRKRRPDEAADCLA